MNKILLVGDVHAGVRLDSEIFLDTFKKFYTEFVPSVIDKHNIKHVFTLGDLFDNRNSLNVKTINVVYECLSFLEEKYPDVTFHFLVGNHDIYYRNTRDINSLKIIESFKNVNVISEIQDFEFGDRKILACPWLVNNEEMEQVFEKEADVCLGHFEINGFQMVEGIVETNGLSQSKFRDNFSLTFSGHFHLRDETQKGIIYVGGPYQTTWADWNDNKGVYVLDLDTLDFEFEENKISPKYQKVFLSILKKNGVSIKEVVPNNFVSLVLDEKIECKTLDKLNDIIANLKPLEFNVVEGLLEYSNVEIDENFSASPLEYIIEHINKNENLETEEIRKDLLNIVNKLYHRTDSV
jgi:DNA repair exonuclease SbcCD nuclease subunit